MRRRLRFAATLLLLPALLLLVPVLPGTQAAASLQNAVRKYQNHRPTREQVQRLGRYDHLIRYFTSFSFFRPGHTVNKDFLRALILSESNAEPRALSGKGARGLTQIIFPTGRQAARELAQRRFAFKYVHHRRLTDLRADDLYDPAINILLCCYLIAKYNAMFGGRLDLVVSAWNAGENSIRDNRPPQYPETLDLIGKVNGYFVHFIARRPGNNRVARNR